MNVKSFSLFILKSKNLIISIDLEVTISSDQIKIFQPDKNMAIKKIKRGHEANSEESFILLLCRFVFFSNALNV